MKRRDRSGSTPSREPARRDPSPAAARESSNLSGLGFFIAMVERIRLYIQSRHSNYFEHNLVDYIYLLHENEFQTLEFLVLVN